MDTFSFTQNQTNYHIFIRSFVHSLSLILSFSHSLTINASIIARSLSLSRSFSLNYIPYLINHSLAIALSFISYCHSLIHYRSFAHYLSFILLFFHLLVYYLLSISPYLYEHYIIVQNYNKCYQQYSLSLVLV